MTMLCCCCITDAPNRLITVNQCCCWFHHTQMLVILPKTDAKTKTKHTNVCGSILFVYDKKNNRPTDKLAIFLVNKEIAAVFVFPHLNYVCAIQTLATQLVSFVFWSLNFTRLRKTEQLKKHINANS